MSTTAPRGRQELEAENEDLRNRVQRLEATREYQYIQMISRLRTNTTFSVWVMEQEFTNVKINTDMFVARLQQCLTDDDSHRARVVRAMSNPGSARALRETLTHNADLRELAMSPLAYERLIFEGYIWRFLIQKVFSDRGTRDIYFAPGESPAYYIRNVDEIDYLMQSGNQNQADEYGRRTWKKQALDAILPTAGYLALLNQRDGTGLFPTSVHPWLAQTRAAKIDELATQLLGIFRVFARPLNNGLDLTRAIVSHAVRLNEFMLHEVEEAYSVELDIQTGSDDDFYDNVTRMNTTVVNTDTRRRMGTVNKLMRGRTQDETRKYLYKVCAIEPALRLRAFDYNNLRYYPRSTQVKPKVAVGWALNRNNLGPPIKENMFYIMARSLGFS